MVRETIELDIETVLFLFENNKIDEHKALEYLRNIGIEELIQYILINGDTTTDVEDNIGDENFFEDEQD